MVCHPVPHPLLPSVSPVRIRPVHGRLAGPGWRGRATCAAADRNHHHQCDAEPLAKPPPQGIAYLGFSATALALDGSMGQSGDFVPWDLRQTLLLLLQVLQTCGKGDKGRGDL